MVDNKISGDTNIAHIPLLEEYKALKAESKEYLKLQNRIVLLLPLIFCAISVLAMIDWRGIVALLLFPWISTLLVLTWAQQDFRRMQINSYISDQLEPSLDLHWSAYQKIFEKLLRNQLAMNRSSLRASLSTLALSAQWLFIVLDLLAAVLLICFLVFSPAGKAISWLVLGLGFLINIALLVFKYWLMLLYPWEKKLPLSQPVGMTVVKQANREAYARCHKAVQDAGMIVVVPPATQSPNYFSSLFEHLLFVEQGTIELRDGSVSPQDRLENREQYVKVCTAGDIACIPPGANYIIANPSLDQGALIKHRRVFIPPFIIR